MIKGRLQFPLRANINFALDGAPLDFVIALNDAIRSGGCYEISFSSGAVVIPHITLLMGRIGSVEHYHCLAAALRSFTSRLRPLSYTLGKPYLRRPSRQFIFVDTQPQQEFRALRSAMYKAIGAFIKCDFHGGPENTSHVTVGYCDKIYSGLPKLEAVPAPNPAFAKTVQLCVAGKRGTCTDLLETIELAAEG